jgi:uncharacterized protein with ParB-like and HNH nuclease domain
VADNKLISISEIFNNRFFRIPDFQRGYSWERPQLEDFWDDLVNLRDENIHYTGLLTVEEINKKEINKTEKWKDDIWLIESGLTPYYIIDGQQRLTTVTVLINEILSKIDGSDINYNEAEFWINKFLYKSYKDLYKSYVFGYEKDNPSDEFFKTKILNQKSSFSDKVPEQTLYTFNLENSKKFFSEKIAFMNNGQIEELFKKLVNKLKFNFYEIDQELDIHVTFETMNNRGKKLSNLELLKNRLIYLTTLFEDEEDKRRIRTDINETWKTIYEYLGKNKSRPLNDDNFLKNHWIIYFTYDRKESNTYATFLLNDVFTTNNVRKKEVTPNEIKKYIESLAESVKSWFYIYNPEYSAYQEEIKEYLQKLSRVGFGAFPPLLMAVFNKEKNNKKILDLLKSCERFSFLIFQVSKRQSNTKNSHYYRMAKNYYFNGLSLEDVIGDINWNIDGEDDDGEYYGEFDLEKFKSHITELYQKSEGFYSWSGIRYFLYEYELHLQEKAKGNQKISWQDYNKRKKEDTIEHIYPQSPNDDCWLNSFKKYNKKEKNKICHSLGNLLLLAHSKNSELQNFCFSHKVKHKNKDGDYSGYFNGSHSEIDVSGNKNWTAEEISFRGQRMLDFLEQRWDIDIEAWGVEKSELLNIPTTKNS